MGYVIIQMATYHRRPAMALGDDDGHPSLGRGIVHGVYVYDGGGVGTAGKERQWYLESEVGSGRKQERWIDPFEDGG